MTRTRPPHALRARAFATLGLLALGAAVALAAEAGLDAAHSTITATFRQENVPVDAPFRQFSGRIDYDAGHPEKTVAAIDVTTASIDLGNPGYSGELAKPSWFDSAKFPQASFRSTAVRVLSPGRLEAAGTLTIKGRQLAITVPIAVGAAGRQPVFDGSYVLSRKAFGIGDADWDSVLDDKVTVKFHLLGPAR
jgi:polyisoprenoid-binding protein YceI